MKDWALLIAAKLLVSLAYALTGLGWLLVALLDWGATRASQGAVRLSRMHSEEWSRRRDEARLKRIREQQL